jgi:hypothetical protein
MIKKVIFKERIHATLQDVTLQDVTLQDVTLQDVTLQDVTLPDVTLQYVTLQDVTFHDIRNIFYIKCPIKRHSLSYRALQKRDTIMSHKESQ